MALVLTALLPLAHVSAEERDRRGASGPTTQIVGGNPVGDGNLSFMAHLRIDIGGDTYACGGSLIAPGYVLTAAHCAVDFEGEPLPAEAFEVTIGATVLSEAGDDDVYAVSAVAVHPKYKPSAQSHDAAVLTLASPVTDPDVQPIEPVAVDGGKDGKGQKAKVAGWGRREYNVPSSASDRLREASLKVAGFKACSETYKENGLRLSKRTMLCGYANGRDTCQGDSGGPIYVKTASGPVQIGITSFGIGCAFKNIPGVYARLTDPSIGNFVQGVVSS